MQRRRGFTLVEVIVVTTMSTLILGIAVALLGAMLRTESTGRDHVYRCAELGRLAEQFRRDVHRATAHNRAGLKAGWQCELPADRTVTYRMGPGNLDRIEQEGQTVRQRESFSLPPNTTASVEVHDDADPPIASLLIAPAPAPTGRSAARTVRIDAILAKDHRFEKPNGS